MSDQDFFFDEEPVKPTSEPAAKSAAKPAAKGGAKSGAAKPAAKPAAPAKARATATPASAAQDAPFLERQTTMLIALLIGVIGLLIGLIGGYALAGAQTPTVEAPASGSIGSVSPQTGTGQAAPQLTPDQLNSGQLPAGHPSLGSSTTTGQ